MKVRTYKDEKGRVGIELIAEFCAEEESLIDDLLKNKLIITGGKSLGRSISIVMKGDVSPFSAIESSKGNRFHLNPFRQQNED